MVNSQLHLRLQKALRRMKESLLRGENNMQRDSRYRYLINISPDHLEVHDLYDERRGCQIDEIKQYKYLIGTSESDLKSWLLKNPNYDGCYWCLRPYNKK